MAKPLGDREYTKLLLTGDLTDTEFELIRRLRDALHREEWLRAKIEDYLLWEPGRAGHAAAHHKLAAFARLRDGEGAVARREPSAVEQGKEADGT